MNFRTNSSYTFKIIFLVFAITLNGSKYRKHLVKKNQFYFFHSLTKPCLVNTLR